MFDYVTGKVLGYGLMLNGLALSGVAVTVHLHNTAHVLFVTPFGLLVAFFGYKVAKSTEPLGRRVLGRRVTDKKDR